MIKPVGITLGDPAGIGPEITIKALKKIKNRNLLLIGSRQVLTQESERLAIQFKSLPILDTGPVGRYHYGQVQKNCGRAALSALDLGVNLLRENGIAALITAPVSKAALRLAGFKFPGQTEFLAARLGARRYAMLAWSPRFKVIFVTIHLPLARVAEEITTNGVLEKIGLLNQFLNQEGKAHPAIGVFALNPHADEFSLGEETIIRRAVSRAKQQGINVTGPLPADSVFAHLDNFDGFVAMYHDQAMIPAKLLAKGAGVNVTLGLGKIRTSPLHGVAFDIAGTGNARPDSMIAAIRLAQKLARRS
jgi:4-hydroxythreonine-4-phosphate dehydrogenase